MKIEKQVERHTIVLETQDIGNDLLVSIYGGDEHHIGGVAIAYSTKSHYRDAATVSVNTLTFPGHKDYLLANSAAERICKALDCPVVVTVGIHMEKATKTEIELAVAMVDSMVTELIENYRGSEPRPMRKH
jgi:hypothetical protein